MWLDRYIGVFVFYSKCFEWFFCFCSFLFYFYILSYFCCCCYCVFAGFVGFLSLSCIQGYVCVFVCIFLDRSTNLLRSLHFHSNVFQWNEIKISSRKNRWSTTINVKFDKSAHYHLHTRTHLYGMKIINYSNWSYKKKRLEMLSFTPESGDLMI